MKASTSTDKAKLPLLPGSHSSYSISKASTNVVNEFSLNSVLDLNVLYSSCTDTTNHSSTSAGQFTAKFSFKPITFNDIKRTLKDIEAKILDSIMIY